MESKGRQSLEKGIAAAKSGNKLLARLHLLEAAERAPQDVTCWMWLAWAAESPDDAVASLRKALAIESGNPLARAGMIWALGMSGQLDAIPFIRMPGEEEPASPVETPPVETSELPAEDAPEPETIAIAVPDAISASEGSEPTVAVEPATSFPNGHPSYEGRGSDATWVDGLTDAGTGFSTRERGLDDTVIDQTGLFPGARANENWETPAVASPIADPEPLAAEDRGSFSAVSAEPEPPADIVEDVPTTIGLSPVRETVAAREGWHEAGPLREERKSVILVVDDSPTICKLVSITLSKRGYQVRSAPDGLEAMNSLAVEKPDLILLDITMPHLDGYRLCKLIKGHVETKHIPVIMLSGKDGFFDKVRGKLVGCTDYITKPFDPEMLIQEVEKHLPTTVVVPST